MTEQLSEKNSLWFNFFRQHAEEDKTVETLLSKVPIFSQLDRRELTKLAAIVHKREYTAGELVFSKGDPGLGMYVIEEGEVEIVIAGPNGSPKVLALLETGDFFGELSLLDESPRSATASVKHDSKIIGFFRPDLIDLLDRSPKAGTKILFKLGEVIGTRLRITNEQLAIISDELEKRSNTRGGGRNYGNRQS
ncbi:MAG TPA: cyclic nucleotide-binding domain-containing protein [Candidatus Kryptonia bacterium]